MYFDVAVKIIKNVFKSDWMIFKDRIINNITSREKFRQSDMHEKYFYKLHMYFQIKKIKLT
jgi:hypothetical protein